MSSNYLLTFTALLLYNYTIMNNTSGSEVSLKYSGLGLKEEVKMTLYAVGLFLIIAIVLISLNLLTH